MGHAHLEEIQKCEKAVHSGGKEIVLVGSRHA